MTEQKQESLAAVKLPGVIEADHLKKEWVLVIYGIPSELSYLGDKLRWICRSHGLWSIDRGGSVYLGPRDPALDQDLNKVIEQLRSKAKTEEKLVHFILGDYSGPQSSYFSQRLFTEVSEDIDLIETSIDELEKALAGEINLKDKEGKDRNLQSLGYNRVFNARRMLEGIDSVAIRFERAEDRDFANKVRIRIRQIGAWIDKVDLGFKRWLKVQKQVV